VTRRNRRPDGSIEKYKAYLVAEGFTQKKEEDYFDTYSPVARLPTIRVLLALDAAYRFHVHQMDVKTTFLNRELEEEIYMQQPKGFVLEGQESKVCHLIKSLYGLKQAPKQWHEKFDNALTTTSFCVNGANKCVYYGFAEGRGVILCRYVDDTLLFGTDLAIIMETKTFLSKNFNKKDLGEANIMVKHKVVYVKIITCKLYASSYIMIITKQLYSSSYALLY
jgi:hypothetical protein